MKKFDYLNIIEDFTTTKKLFYDTRSRTILQNWCLQRCDGIANNRNLLKMVSQNCLWNLFKEGLLKSSCKGPSFFVFTFMLYRFSFPLLHPAPYKPHLSFPKSCSHSFVVAVEAYVLVVDNNGSSFCVSGSYVLLLPIFSHHQNFLLIFFFYGSHHGLRMIWTMWSISYCIVS